MKYIIYVSTAVRLMTDDDLFHILSSSRANNEALHVTGMLMYSEGTFIQALEGNNDDVDYVYSLIEQDPRHKNIIKLVDNELYQRNFTDWMMAFVAVEAMVLDEMDGYINPITDNFIPGDNTHPAVTILRIFADNNIMQLHTAVR